MFQDYDENSVIIPATHHTGTRAFHDGWGGAIVRLTYFYFGGWDEKAEQSQRTHYFFCAHRWI
jgi:hypothetical protein